MVLTDLPKIILIDKDIRDFRGSITYEDLPVKKIFGMEEAEVNTQNRPSISEAANRIDLGFVAEIENDVCGFILGQVATIHSGASKFGEITIIGVHPNHLRIGIATSLLSSLCDQFKTKGIRAAVAGVVSRDRYLVAFFEKMMFNRGPLMNYIKIL